MPLPHDPRYDGPPEDPRDLRSRSDAKRERKDAEDQLMSLARSLVELSDRMLGKLQLGESLLEVVQHTRSITSPVAKNRAMRAVRMALRREDCIELQRRLREATDPSGGGAGKLIEYWRERLVSGSQEAMDEFVQQYPEADRQQLRQHVRNVAKSTPEARVETLRAFSKVLRQHIR